MSRPAARRTHLVTLAGIFMILGLVWWMSDIPSSGAPAPNPAIDTVGAAARVAETVPTAPPQLPLRAPTPVVIPDTRETVVLDVRSSTGEPVRLVEVSDALTGERFRTTVTDDGLTVRCDGAHDLLVRAPRHFAHTVPADVVEEHLSKSMVLECTLVAAYRLSGASNRADGRAGPPGATVLAWPSGHPPSAQDAIRAAAEREPASTTDEPARIPGAVPDVRLLVTSTDEDGAFAFRDPIPDGRYTITLAGRGVSADRRIYATPSVRTRYSIPLQSVYGLGVQFIDPGGQYLPGLRTTLGGTPTFGFSRQGVGGVGLRRPFEIECCLLDPVLEDPLSEGIHTVMLMGTSQLDEVGPVQVIGKHPGRETVHIDAFVPALVDGLSVMTVILEPSGVPTGVLELVVVGWEEAILGADPREFDLTLNLAPVDEAGPLERGRAWFNGTWFEGDTLTIQGIAHGEYVLDLDFGPHKVRLSRNATISDEVEHLAFELPSLGTGALLVEVVDRRDAPFGGVVHLELQRPDGRHVWDHQFDAAPYVIPVLRPGVYQMSMTHAYAGEGDYPTARSGIIEVAAGERTTVRLAFDQMH